MRINAYRIRISHFIWRDNAAITCSMKYEYVALPAVRLDRTVLPLEDHAWTILMMDKIAPGDTVQQMDTENQEGSDAVQRQSKERRRPQTAVPRLRSSTGTLSTSRLAVPRISQEVMRNAIEVCQTGMVLVDHTGVIVLVNVEVERLFGYKRSELIGQTVDLLLPENLRNQHASHREGYTVHPKTCMGLGRVLSGLHKDGSVLDIEVGLNAIDTR